MKWFRVYNDIARDRKLRRHKPHVRWAWISVLCIASESPQRGNLLLSEDIPATIEDIADEAALSVTEMEEAISIFVKQGMIENVGDVWKVINWNRRQFDRDNSSERVKRFRNKQEKHSVTVTETPCNGYESVSVTPPEYRVQSTENNPLPPSSEKTPKEAGNEVKNPADELVLEFHKKFPEHRKRYSLAGAAKLNDEITQMLADGFTEDDILNRIDWIKDECPAPWDLRTVDPPPYGRGRRFATEKEYQDWAISMV